VLDSTRCISYLTIELKGEIPPALQSAIGSHVYGCDICQEVCPWNAAPLVSTDPAWQPRPAWDAADVRTLSTQSDEELRASLRGSAMRRTKLVGLRRNLAVSLANLNSCEPRPPEHIDAARAV
jgi:epoxyqueuosine reductase